jgi:hypothetical protein
VVTINLGGVGEQAAESTVVRQLAEASSGFVAVDMDELLADGIILGLKMAGRAVHLAGRGPCEHEPCQRGALGIRTMQ